MSKGNYSCNRAVIFESAIILLLSLFWNNHDNHNHTTITTTTTTFTTTTLTTTTLLSRQPKLHFHLSTLSQGFQVVLFQGFPTGSLCIVARSLAFVQGKQTTAPAPQRRTSPLTNAVGAQPSKWRIKTGPIHREKRPSGKIPSRAGKREGAGLPGYKEALERREVCVELRRGSPGVELRRELTSGERVFLLALSPWSTEAPVEPERSRQSDRR